MRELSSSCLAYQEHRMENKCFKGLGRNYGGGGRGASIFVHMRSLKNLTLPKLLAGKL